MNYMCVFSIIRIVLVTVNSKKNSLLSTVMKEKLLVGRSASAIENNAIRNCEYQKTCARVKGLMCLPGMLIFGNITHYILQQMKKDDWSREV